MNTKVNCKQNLHNQTSIITGYRSQITERHALLAKKYFALWKLFIQYKIKNKYILEKQKIYEEKIFNFISKSKVHNLAAVEHDFSVKNNPLDTSRGLFSKNKKDHLKNECFENRFQAQKRIIENQKALIAEQSSIINTLKDSITMPIVSIVESPKENFDSLKETTKVHKTFPKPFEHPLVKKMKEREEGRKNRRFLLKKQKEKLLDEKLQQEEAERKKQQIEKRNIRIKEKKEKEKMIKELELKNQKEQEVCKDLNLKAKFWYQILLYAKVLKSWKAHMQYLFNLQMKCTEIYEKSLLTRLITKWKNHNVFINDLLRNIVTSMDDRYILITAWYHWKQKENEVKRQRNEIRLWFHRKIEQNVFIKWLQLTNQSIFNKQFIVKSTSLFYERLLLMRTFNMWKNLPHILYFEREKEKRLRDWENKVKSILPDYNMNSF